MALVDRNTFIAVETDEDGTIRGTVDVRLRGTTKRVKALFMTKYGWIIAYGIIGRYQTGSKAWPASIRSNPDGREDVNFGRDDRHPKFRKENAIWFAE